MFWNGTRWIDERASALSSRPHRRARDWVATGVMVVGIVALAIPYMATSAASPSTGQLVASWSGASATRVVQGWTLLATSAGKGSHQQTRKAPTPPLARTPTPTAAPTATPTASAVFGLPAPGTTGSVGDTSTVTLSWSENDPNGTPTRTLSGYDAPVGSSGCASSSGWVLAFTRNPTTTSYPIVGFSSGYCYQFVLTLADSASTATATSGYLLDGAVPAPTATPTPTPTPTPTLSTVGNTYYISPTGSDSAAGSLGAPRRSLFGASQLLHPGDTLYVRGGTYYPTTNGWAGTASGTAAAPITVEAYPGETPVFDGGATAPSTAGNYSHPQQGVIVQNVSYVTFQGLTFVHYDPWDNGIFLVLSSDHITFRNIHGYAEYTTTASEHYFYIVHSSNILIDGCSLEGIAGDAVQIYDSDYVVGSGAVGSSHITVQNSTLTNNGTGILAGSGLVGGSFTGNVITATADGFHFDSTTSGVDIGHNTITAPVGIWSDSLTSYGPTSEHNDAINSAKPFMVTWGGVLMTLAQWQATGRGVGTTVTP